MKKPILISVIKMLHKLPLNFNLKVTCFKIFSIINLNENLSILNNFIFFLFII